MKTVYLSEKPKMIQKVFMAEENIFSKEYVLNNPEKFKDTEFVFSTWGMSEYSETEIKEYLPKLKAIFYGAGTVQYFARPFLNCGVRVFSAWAANAVPVAEYTVAQIVLANKGFFRTMRFTDARTSKRLFNQYPGNYDVKVGIIGAGMIGRMVIERLKAYNLEVLVFDPFLPDEKAKELGVTKTSLENVFAECQVVSNHLANNEATKGMLNGELFEKMLPNATFLNTGRGAQVVESDLITLLKSRPDVTAILDVTEPEPPLEDSEFYTLENCILTPHIAGSSGNEVRRMAEYMRQEYQNFIENKATKYEVTLEMLKTMA
ncbi:MAG: hydroxyacid dehydrogenase [Ruminococcaceae bacterium]|nr:hydroxyacid dehydrogenase [Oscillospiraceae bacterium]